MRERPITLAERRFAENAEELGKLTPAERFGRIFETNLWEDRQSRSGPGSSLHQTRRVREQLPGLLRGLQVRTLLDVPCGDFHWMAHVDLEGVRYIGGDIVEAVIAQDRERYARPDREFVRLDLTTGPLPAADALLCRDCLVHLSFANIRGVLDTIRGSEIGYFITTTFLEQAENIDIVDGNWRPINMERAPFNFPSPAAVIVEECEEENGAFADKALGVWRVSDLPCRESSPGSD